MICNMNRWNIIFLLLFLSGCVSVSLPTSTTAKATGVRLSAPNKPFNKLDEAALDQAWMSSKTGNAISYLSECGPSTDRTLEVLQAESLNVLSKLKVEEERNFDFNGRKAMWATASGEVDGVPVKMSLVTLKKNNCNYSLTYSGLEKNFSSEQSHFKSFVDSFEAP